MPERAGGVNRKNPMKKQIKKLQEACRLKAAADHKKIMRQRSYAWWVTAQMKSEKFRVIEVRDHYEQTKKGMECKGKKRAEVILMAVVGPWAMVGKENGMPYVTEVKNLELKEL
jgi:hypothetical protein